MPKDYRLDEKYDKAFAAFLEHTDEKEIFIREISTRIKAVGAQSLLDIGAGNGDLSIPLSRPVPDYTAIEQKKSYADKLRSARISVMEAEFPIQMPRAFDFVLMSHSIPWHSAQYRPFLNSAFACVAPGGSLLGITYDDEQSEWSDMLKAVKLPVEQRREGRVDKLKDAFSAFGECVVSIVTSVVSAENCNCLILALTFVYSDGEPVRALRFQEQREEVRSYIEEHYASDSGSSYFPFSHIFLQVRKS